MQFQVERANFANTRLVAEPSVAELSKLGEGQALLEVERFSFTANNITYAVAGDQLRYWQFFPPLEQSADSSQWGVIPVWGYANVVASTSTDIAVGERLFGYFPTGRYVTIEPKHANAHQLFDGSKHRADLPPGYNLYRRAAAGATPAQEAEQMLLWPLHVTSFCLWDSLKEHEWHQAAQIIILSASSKTSLGLAYGLHDDDMAPAVIGVTSAGNFDFVQSLNVYDEVQTYDALDDIKNDVPTTIVDMSGDLKVLSKLHSHLGGNINYCLQVGLTHWDAYDPRSDFGVPQAQRSFFFAPDHIQRRMQEWGAVEFGKRSGDFLKKTTARCREWLDVEVINGLNAFGDVYPQVLRGSYPSSKGLIVDCAD